MKKLAILLGIWGAALGMLAGLIELSIGAQIRPWIGNKETPVILGLVTFLLSGMALAAVTAARKPETPTNDGKLAIFLGVLLPAAICFTTVGRLWYLPGTLLLAAAALLAYEFWLTPQATVSSRPSGRAWRLMAGIGSLVILLSIGLAFWNSSFGLFQVEIPVRVDRLRLEVLPMDLVRRTAFTNGVRAGRRPRIQPGKERLSLLDPGRWADFHCQSGFIPFVYQDRRRRSLARVTALFGLAARDFVAGAIYVCLFRSAQIPGMGLVSFNRRPGHDLKRRFLEACELR